MLSQLCGIAAIIFSVLPVVLMVFVPVESGWIWQSFNVMAMFAIAASFFFAKDLPDNKPPVYAGFAFVTTIASFSAIGMYFMYV